MKDEWENCMAEAWKQGMEAAFDQIKDALSSDEDRIAKAKDVTNAERPEPASLPATRR